MAFYNSVRLYARVVSKETKITSDAADRPYMAQCMVCVLKSKRDYGDRTGSMQWEIPQIITWDPIWIAKLRQLRQNDIVDIEGYVSTYDLVKSVRCPECGNIVTKPGVVTYVNPVFMEIRGTGLTQEESIAEIIKNAEVSNSVKLFGRLTNDPSEVKYVTSKRTVYSTKYTMSVKRLRYFAWEPPERVVDYPVVRAYGDLGAENLAVLHGPGGDEDDGGQRIRGSEVMVDGFLQARKVMQHSKCDECGTEFEWPDLAMEVVPFNVEYARDCSIPESSGNGTEQSSLTPA